MSQENVDLVRALQPGPEVEIDMDAEVMLFGSAVYTVSDGTVLRVEFFQDRKRAFDAVGLPQQDV